MKKISEFFRKISRNFVHYLLNHFDLHSKGTGGLWY